MASWVLFVLYNLLIQLEDIAFVVCVLCMQGYNMEVSFSRNFICVYQYLEKFYEVFKSVLV